MDIIIRQTNRTHVILASYVVLVWFLLAVTGSLLGVFVQPPGIASLPFFLVVGVPILLFVGAYLLSEAFRRFVGTLVGDPWGITALQTYRVLGGVFVILVSRNVLPSVFGLPAGWGDTFIGVTALLVAWAWSSGSRSGKVAFVLWNVLGMLDLVIAVTMGALASVLQPGTITMDPIRTFPLSLVPTFAVPLSFILHFIGLAQFRHLSFQRAQTD